VFGGESTACHNAESKLCGDGTTAKWKLSSACFTTKLKIHGVESTTESQIKTIFGQKHH